MPSNEAIELIESVLGDAISKQKNKMIFSNNMNQAKHLEDYARDVDSESPYLSPDLEEIRRKALEKAGKAANELRRLDPTSYWTINKKDKIEDKIQREREKRERKNDKLLEKMEAKRAKHEAAQILIEALDTLLSE